MAREKPALRSALDLVAVVKNRGPREREEKTVHQLDSFPVVAEQRSQAPPDAEVEARQPVLRVGAVHVVALFVGDHLERELVVVAQKQGPLRRVGDGRRLREDVDDREPVLHADRHEQARHEREVERHVAFVAIAEVGDRILRPLVGLGQEHAIGVVRIDVAAHLLEELMRLRQVLAVGALALEQIRNGVEPHAIDAHAEPEVQRLQHRLLDLGVFEVQVRLMRVEPVPEVRPGHVVPRPVRGLEVLEDDSRVLVFLVGLAPDVEVARGAAGPGPAGALEPRMLV